MASFGDTVLVALEDCLETDSHQLYTNLEIAGLGGNHNLMIRDNDLPLDVLGAPVFTPAWQYLIGINCNTNTTNGYTSVVGMEMKVFSKSNW